MDAIKAARELGKAIQAEECFLRMSMAQQKSDEDDELQEMIQQFNAKRVELNRALQDKEKNAEQIPVLDTEIKAMYEKIFENENMAEFTAARGEVEQMVTFINQIISGSTQGMNPDAIAFQEASCGGDCGGCSGCS